MPWKRLSHQLLLPELEMLEIPAATRTWTHYRVRSTAKEALCPRCPTLSHSVYDRRLCTVKGALVRDQIVFLKIEKRRFWCKNCQQNLCWLCFQNPLCATRRETSNAAVPLAIYDRNR